MPAPKWPKKAVPPQRARAQSISSAAAAAAATVKQMEDDEVLEMAGEMAGADLITSRLAQWGIAEDEEEEDTIVVDQDKVLSCYLYTRV